MIAEILPEDVFAVEQFGTHGGFLLAEESATLGDAVSIRRAEFMAGRTCARKALGAMGVSTQPILIGEGREPLWPAGIVGSITHCDRYCAAAVAPQDKFLGVGIDAEPNEILPAGLLTTIARDEEIDMLRNLPLSFIHWDRLLFNAKECFYKVWYPRMKCWLGFDEASVTIDPDSSTFQVRLIRADSRGSTSFVSQLTGHYLVSHGYILSTMILTYQDVDRSDEPQPFYTA